METLATGAFSTALLRSGARDSRVLLQGSFVDRSWASTVSIGHNAAASSKGGQMVQIQARRKFSLYRMQKRRMEMHRERMYKAKMSRTLPPKEDDNPRFVIFIRSKEFPIWSPLNVVSGGNAAKFLVGVTKNDVGKWVYGSALTNNVARAIYKEEDAIIPEVKKANKLLRDSTEFEYGYKLVDEDNVDDALKIKGIVKIPPKEEVKVLVDKVKDKVGELVGQGVGNIKDRVESIKGSLGMSNKSSSEAET